VDSDLQRHQPNCPGSREPEYQKFVEETGFQFERDLDQAAFAIHYPQLGRWVGGLGFRTALLRSLRRPDRLRPPHAYLKKISSSIDDYRGFEIYNISL